MFVSVHLQPDELSCERSVTSRGRDTLICNGYRMRHQYTGRNHSTWRCNRAECNARVATDRKCTHVKRIYKWHNHPHLRKWTPRKSVVVHGSDDVMTTPTQQESDSSCLITLVNLKDEHQPHTSHAIYEAGDRLVEDDDGYDDDDLMTSERSSADSTIHIELETNDAGTAGNVVSSTDDVEATVFTLKQDDSA